MTGTDLETRVSEVIRMRHPEFDLQAARDKSFFELGIDSIEVLSVVFEIEENLGISIPTEELRQVRTTGDLVRLVSSIVTAADTSAAGA